MMNRHTNPPRPAALKHERRLAWERLPFVDSQPVFDDAGVPWREDVIEVLDDALHTEMVCVLRYRSELAAVGQPEAQRDVLPGGGDAQRIADRIVERLTRRLFGASVDEQQPQQAAQPLREAGIDEADDFRADRPAEPHATRAGGDQRRAEAYLDDRDPPVRGLREDVLRQADRADPDDWLAR